jgi:hypothetical protein
MRELAVTQAECMYDCAVKPAHAMTTMMQTMLVIPREGSGQHMI